MFFSVHALETAFAFAAHPSTALAASFISSITYLLFWFKIACVVSVPFSLYNIKSVIGGMPVAGLTNFCVRSTKM